MLKLCFAKAILKVKWIAAIQAKMIPFTETAGMRTKIWKTRWPWPFLGLQVITFLVLVRFEPLPTAAKENHMIYVQWSPPTQVYFGTVSDMYFDNLPGICSDISSTIYWFYLALSLTWWLASCLTFYVAYWVRRPQRTCELAISTSWREGPQAILKSRDLHLAGGELEVEQPMKT
jgi:hypothetical protein